MGSRWDLDGVKMRSRRDLDGISHLLDPLDPLDSILPHLQCGIRRAGSLTRVSSDSFGSLGSYGLQWVEG